MSRVYTARFYGPVYSTVQAGALAFEVPAGHIYVVREVIFSFSGPSDVVVPRLAIGTSASPTGTVVSVSVAKQATYRQELRLPMVEGEQMWRAQSLAEGVAVTISGYDFLT